CEHSRKLGRVLSERTGRNAWLDVDRWLWRGLFAVPQECRVLHPCFRGGSHEEVHWFVLAWPGRVFRDFAGASRRRACGPGLRLQAQRFRCPWSGPVWHLPAPLLPRLLGAVALPSDLGNIVLLLSANGLLCSGRGHEYGDAPDTRARRRSGLVGR